MTVSELIEKLKEFPANHEVCATYSDTLEPRAAIVEVMAVVVDGDKYVVLVDEDQD